MGEMAQGRFSPPFRWLVGEEVFAGDLPLEASWW